jgi:peroxiredoxin
MNQNKLYMRRKMWAFAICCGLTLASCATKEVEIEIGSQMPEFTLTETVGSKALLGKPTLIIFFATWCPACQSELECVQGEYEYYKSEGKINILGIARGESQETIDLYWHEHQLTFPVYVDPQRKVYSLFAQKEIPRCYLFDASGKLVFQSKGYSPEQVEELHKMVQLRVSF